jgi:hypothetical protein
VPLGITGESGGTTILLDTQSGRTWHVILDDRGRPRWRGIEMAGGSQALAEAPGERTAPAAEDETSAEEEVPQEAPPPQN